MSAPTRPRRDAYEIATAAVLGALDAGTVPWRQPWSALPGRNPRNAITGRRYRGINTVLLHPALTGRTDPRWLTVRQANKAGGHVRKGERHTPAVVWKRIRKTLRTAAQVAEQERAGRVVRTDAAGARYVEFTLAKVFNLFNVEQTAGVAWEPVIVDQPAAWQLDATAETIVRGYEDGPTISEGAIGASYHPASDHVAMPDRAGFSRPRDWYAVLYHELTHSTGHRDRLARPDLLAPNSDRQAYAREELTAEMGAAMLASVAGIDSPELTANQAAYIDSWRSRISQDPRLVVLAAQRAQKAADRILGVEPPAVGAPAVMAVAR